jgi:hypothetical protein
MQITLSAFLTWCLIISFKSLHMKNIVKILILTVMALSLGSCYYDTFPEDNDNGPAPVDVSYANDIQPMWDNDCVSCHQGNIPPDLTAAKSYNDLLNGGYVIPNDADNSVLYHSLFGSNGVSLMPPGAMWPSSSIKKVESWINEGAKNN